MSHISLVRAIVECFFDSTTSKNRGLYKEIHWLKGITDKNIILLDENYKKALREIKKEKKGKTVKEVIKQKRETKITKKIEKIAEMVKTMEVVSVSYPSISKRIEQIIKNMPKYPEENTN